MSSPRWTEEQQAAINLRGQILVAAAAGSGKTAVLVERLLRRITDPRESVDVDRFLVVTFTKAAANEMRERIGKALDDAVFKETDPSEVERLLKQRSLLNRASITTLHSFCMDLIRRYFYELELDPSFRVADEAEADLLRQDTLQELFEVYYEKESTAFQELVEAFGSDRDDLPLMENVLRLFEFAYSQVNPEEWLENLAHAYEWQDVDELIRSPWGEAVRQGLLDRVGESKALLERAYQLAVSPDGPRQYAEVMQDDLRRLYLLEKALQEGNWEEVEKQFHEAADFPSLPSGSRKKSKSQASNPDLNMAETRPASLREESKKVRDEAKDKLKKLNDEIFHFPLREQLPYLQQMARLIRTLAALVREFAQEYAAAKRQRNVVDFTDLEHFALRLLQQEGKPSALAQNLREFFTEVLVDEYQDINPVQERILQLVSRSDDADPNLFMVGDVKQSIYRFRMADPSLFLAKYTHLPHWAAGYSHECASPGKLAEELACGPEKLQPNEPANSGLVIDLNRNFRSRLEVVEGVNFLFRQIMTAGAGEIPYDDQAALQCGASYLTGQEHIRTAEGPIEVHLFDPKQIVQSVPGNSLNQGDSFNNWENTLESDDNNGNIGNDENNGEETSQGRGEDSSGEEPSREELTLEELEAARIEARLVGNRIRRIIEEEKYQIFDNNLNNFRPVRYSDIVVLMRSYSAVAPIYVEEFQNRGIPVYAETSSGYFAATEVETVLSLLKVIDNPRLDIPLAAVLRSPLVGLNGAELGKLRAMLPRGDFYETLVLAYWASLEEGDYLLDAENPLLTAHIPLDTVREIQQVLGIYQKAWPRLLARARETLQNAPELKEKISKFWTKLQNWRTKARRTSLAELIWLIYEETGYLAYVGTLPGGVQRQANLRVLYDRACRFETTNYRGLFRFLRFLEKFQGQGKDMGSARALGENEDVVRLITVHASKGLEFPFVFVVGLGHSFNTRSLSGRLLLHSKLGAGVPIIDVANRVRYPSFIQYAVKQRLWQEALAEELRILYVALTRAKERLFLYGSVAKLENRMQKWLRAANWEGISFPDGQLRSAKSFLDWIGPALARHPARLFKQDLEPPCLDIPEISSQWEIYIEKSLNNNEQIQTSVTKTSPQALAEDPELLYAEVDKRLSWQYPYQAEVHQAAKTSVSELKRRFAWASSEEAVQVPYHGAKESRLFMRPKFLQKEHTLTAAERGIAFHSVMQHLPIKEWGPVWVNLSPARQEVLLREYLENLLQKEILTPEQLKSITPGQIMDFLKAPVGLRLLQCEEVLREVPFTLALNPQSQNKPVLLQGVIDALLLNREQGTAEIIDYKTDAFSTEMPDPEDILLKRYAVQLSLYSLAVKRLLKLRIDRCTIYSVGLKREIDIPVSLIKEQLERLAQGSLNLQGV